MGRCVEPSDVLIRHGGLLSGLLADRAALNVRLDEPEKAVPMSCAPSPETALHCDDVSVRASRLLRCKPSA